MRETVSSTSDEACDCLPVASAIWPMSSLERETDSMMLRSAAPALSARAMPCLASDGARARHLDRVGRLLLHLADDLADLLGRLHRALGELAHLVGDHREAAAGLAGARRLDGGVQGEQVRLVGDLLDHLEDAPDLLRALAEAGDDAGGVLHVLGDGLHAVHGARPPPRRRSCASSEARALMRSASEAILATSVHRARHAGDGGARARGRLAERLGVLRPPRR